MTAFASLHRRPGPHYPVPGYPPGPPPAHRVEIWVGAYRPRALRYIGAHGDGWIPSQGYMGPDAFRQASARIDEAAIAAGRDPADIRRLYNFGGAITDEPAGDGPLDGPVDKWVATLMHWATDLGVNGFILWPADRLSLERYATEVVPRVKEALGIL